MTSDDTSNIDTPDQTNMVNKVSEKRVVVSERTESGEDSTYTTAAPGNLVRESSVIRYFFGGGGGEGQTAPAAEEPLKSRLKTV